MRSLAGEMRDPMSWMPSSEFSGNPQQRLRQGMT